MRHTSAVLDDTATPVDRGKYYSRTEVLKINQRSHELCSAANMLAQKTGQLVEASHRLQDLCKELLHDAEMLRARMNSHARGAGSAKDPAQRH